LRRSGGLAFGVVGVGGETEADDALVRLFRGGVELRQTGEIADYERENAGGEGVEGAEMADGALLQDAAYAVDDVVGGEACGLIDN
jgi:hypothetical protein